jgi:hypothetical protein
MPLRIDPDEAVLCEVYKSYRIEINSGSKYASVLVVGVIAAYLSSSRSRKYAHIVTFGIEPRKVLGSAEIACALTQQLPLRQAVELAEAVIEPSA